MTTRVSLDVFNKNAWLSYGHRAGALLERLSQ